MINDKEWGQGLTPCNFPHRDDRGENHWIGGEHIHIGPEHVRVR